MGIFRRRPWHYRQVRRPRIFTAPAGASFTGTLDATVGAVTSTGAGALTFSGTLDATVGAVTATGAGSLIFSGTCDVTVGAVTSTGVGELTYTGTLAVTVGAVTSTGAGIMAPPVTGTLDATVGAVTLTGAGTLPDTSAGGHFFPTQAGVQRLRELRAQAVDDVRELEVEIESVRNEPVIDVDFEAISLDVARQVAADAERAAAVLDELQTRLEARRREQEELEMQLKKAAAMALLLAVAA